MHPAELKTRIFLDSGDPGETREALKLLGFLDGQTTNPSLIAKNPETAGRKFSKEEILEFYKKVVREIFGLIPEGSVSIEVYADKDTPPLPSLPHQGGGSEGGGSMLEQAREFNTWISPHPPEYRPLPLPQGERATRMLRTLAHIKFPTTTEGLKAAEQAVKEVMRVNMTLVFSQEQAAAVYAATRGATRGQVFVSPFVGRLDDRGERGMDLIANILKMYAAGDGHVEVLTASVRNVEHMSEALELGSDIVTAPLKILREWAATDFPPLTRGGIKGEVTHDSAATSLPSSPLVRGEGLTSIPYKEIDLNKPWQEYDIKHELTDKGIERFAADWNSLIQ